MGATIQVKGQEQFRAAARQMAAAEKTTQAEVAKGFRAVAKPIVAAIRTEVKSSKGTAERGVHASTVERQLHTLARSGRGELKPLSDRQKQALHKRLARAESLRDSIAAAAGSSASAGNLKASLAFRVRAGALPPSQRKLPRRWDSPTGWRHPVFGNREVWVKQVGHPYFRSTINSRRGELDSGVQAAFETAGIKIMTEEHA